MLYASGKEKICSGKEQEEVSWGNTIVKRNSLAWQSLEPLHKLPHLVARKVSELGNGTWSE